MLDGNQSKCTMKCIFDFLHFFQYFVFVEFLLMNKYELKLELDNRLTWHGVVDGGGYGKNAGG